MSDSLETGWKLWFQQLKALLWKNFTLARRNKTVTSLRYVATLLFMLLTYGVDQAIQIRRKEGTESNNLVHPIPEKVNSIPRCEDQMFRLLPCKDFLYAPSGDPTVEKLVAAIRANNDPPIPATKVVGMATSDAADEYMMANPERVMASYSFDVDPTDPTKISFLVQINSTVMYSRGIFQDGDTFAELPLQVL